MVGLYVTIALALYWSAWKPVPENDTGFAHVRGDGDKLWSGHDGWPQDGAAPTTTWSPGEIEVDQHSPLAANTSTGLYQIEIELYDGATGARLRLEPAGRPEEND